MIGGHSLSSEEATQAIDWATQISFQVCYTFLNTIYFFLDIDIFTNKKGYGDINHYLQLMHAASVNPNSAKLLAEAQCEAGVGNPLWTLTHPIHIWKK